MTLNTNLLNYKFFVIETSIHRIKIAITNDIYTNHLETNVKTTALTNRYFVNDNISTNFGDYLARTNGFVVYICTSSIEQSNNIYYYSNLFYSLFSSNLTFYSNGQVESGFLQDGGVIGDFKYASSLFRTSSIIFALKKPSPVQSDGFCASEVKHQKNSDRKIYELDDYPEP